MKITPKQKSLLISLQEGRSEWNMDRWELVMARSLSEKGLIERQNINNEVLIVPTEKGKKYILESKKNQKLYAFWEYDKFPYVLGAEIQETLGNGKILTKKYPGFSFKPKKILPCKEGRAKHKKLEDLSREYKNELDNLHKKYCEKANSII